MLITLIGKLKAFTFAGVFLQHSLVQYWWSYYCTYYNNLVCWIWLHTQSSEVTSVICMCTMQPVGKKKKINYCLHLPLLWHAVAMATPWHWRYIWKGGGERQRLGERWDKWIINQCPHSFAGPVSEKGEWSRQTVVLSCSEGQLLGSHHDSGP